MEAILAKKLLLIAWTNALNSMTTIMTLVDQKKMLIRRLLSAYINFLKIL